MKKKKLLNYPIILRLLGILLLIEGMFLLITLPFSLYYGEADNLKFQLFTAKSDFWPLLLSAAFTIIVGGFVVLLGGKNAVKTITRRDGYVIVALTWIVISVLYLFIRMLSLKPFPVLQLPGPPF